MVGHIDDPIFAKSIVFIYDKQTLTDASGQDRDGMQDEARMLTERTCWSFEHMQLVFHKENQSTTLVLAVIVERDLTGTGCVRTIAMKRDAGLNKTDTSERWIFECVDRLDNYIGWPSCHSQGNLGRTPCTTHSRK